MTLGTLLLLRQVLSAQQLHVGDDGFRESARAVLVALDELDGAVEAARSAAEGSGAPQAPEPPRP